MLKLITKNCFSTSDAKLIKKYKKQVLNIGNGIKKNYLPGLEMTGWTDPTNFFDNSQLNKMFKKANSWKKEKIKNIVLIGIGGSYLGIRAAIEMCNGIVDQKINFYYLHNMASSYVYEIMKKINKSKFAIVVISKSGTTLEPAICFNLLRNLMLKNFKAKYTNDHIVAITDANTGCLHDLAIKNNWTSFVIPNNIGGRFSTLTPVGIFPMILANINIRDVLKGAAQALADTKSFNLSENSAFLYAVYRYYFYTEKKKKIENFIVYDPSLQFIGEQWKQIFGESEGKNNKALYPTTSLFTTDLHSIGQYLQEGNKNFVETTLWVNKPRHEINLKIKDNVDKLKYLDGWNLNDVNKMAFKGTINAHSTKGKIDNLIIEIDKSDAYHYGYLFMWLSKAAMMSGYLLKINPFNQPGVEAYKKNMFSLLNKK